LGTEKFKMFLKQIKFYKVMENLVINQILVNKISKMFLKFKQDI